MPAQRGDHSEGRGTPDASAPERRRVLVVDSNVTVLGLVGRLLEKDFMVAGLVVDADSVIERWRATRPHVIVLDVALGTGGFEIAARLRHAGCDLPLVFLSAHEGPDVVRAAWNAGGLGFVVRRDVTWDLIPAVEAALRGCRYVSTAAQPR